MNKTYMAPKVKTIEMNTVNIIAASNLKVLPSPLEPGAAEGRESNDDFDD